MSKTKVLYVFGGEKASGAEIVIERLMGYNDLVEPHLFIAPGTFTDKLLTRNTNYTITVQDRLKKLNRSSTSALKFYFTAILNYFYLFKTTYAYIKRHNIAVVHANTITPSSYMVPLIYFRTILGVKAKFIWSDHDLQYYATLDNFLSKLCYKMYDLTLVVSKAVGQKYAPGPKNVVLYNGLDAQRFKADLDKRNSFRSKYAFNAGDIVIGMPAVIAPRKGQLELISAFNKLTNHKARLVFAGSFADDSPDYSAQVKALSNTIAIQYIGRVDDMNAFYNGCDIIINNSNISGSEPLGTTIYEAMACKKIVIASDTGGTAEIVDDGLNGYLFKADNEADLVKKLDEVITNFDGLDSVRDAARAKAIERFDIRKMADSYNKLLLKVSNIN